MPFTAAARALPLSDFQLTDPFWKERLRVLVEVGLPHQYRQLAEATPRLQNFRRAAGQEEGPHEGRYYDDSDVYKWIEAASDALALHPDDRLRSMLDEVVRIVLAAQAPDGYLHTYIQLNFPDKRWKNLAAVHEMYCAGHLIEAAVARYESLGERDLLDAAIRLADHIEATFGEGPGRRRGYCGHQELEIAFIRLSDATGDQRYEDLARWMVEARGQADSPFVREARDPDALAVGAWIERIVDSDGKYVMADYFQDHAPIREQTEIVGHAVRGMYFFTAATELARRREDPTLEDAIRRVWDNLTGKRMYVTGGIGPSSHNEGFTVDYDLPNLTSYAETCASVGLAFWARRLVEATGESEFADVMERAVFNGALAGISLEGDRYFYANPLESRGRHSRVPWFDCACCPPNIARMIASVPRLAYSWAENGLWMHIPVGGEFTVNTEGIAIQVTVDTDYPFGSLTRLRFATDRPSKMTLRIRIPEWCDDATLRVTGGNEEADYDHGYAVLSRTWHNGDQVEVDFPITPRWIEAHPRVLDCSGRVALTAGPLVYCLEGADAPRPPQMLVIDTDEPLESVTCPNGFPGWRMATLRRADEEGPLYAKAEEEAEFAVEPATFGPYFAWGARGADHMQVWLRRWNGG